MDYREMAAQSENALLNETKPQYRSDGRVRRDEYRGQPKEVWKGVQADVLAQNEDKKVRAEAEKQEDLYIDSVMNNNRSLLVAAEREKGRQYKALGESIIGENAALLNPKKNERPDASMDTDEYFKFYGTSTR